MSNAAKYRKKAAEYEQLRQIDRAIAAYIKAIEESESAGEEIDVTLFNKVGDLALRQGRVPDAITYYERAVEHYIGAGLANNAIALCNKILRNAPGRANVYFTLGRICARKGLRGDATRNFLEYATRMQQDGRIEEGMRALAEVADLMPELTEVQSLVEEHAARVGITLPRRRTPMRAEVAVEESDEKQDLKPAWLQRSSELVFLDVDYAGTPSKSSAPDATQRGVHAAHAPHSTALTKSIAISTAPVAPVPTDAVVTAPLATRESEASQCEPAITSDLTVEVSSDVASEVSSDLSGTILPDQEAIAAELAPDEGIAAEMANAEPPVVQPLGDELASAAFAELAEIEIAPAEGFSPTVSPPEAAAQDIVAVEGLEPVDSADIGLVEVEWIVPPEPGELEVPDLALMEMEDDVVGPELVMLDLEAPEVQSELETQVPELPAQPVFRIDPHDFVQSGELQPLVLSDDFVDQGIRLAAGRETTLPEEPSQPEGSSEEITPAFEPVSEAAPESAEVHAVVSQDQPEEGSEDQPEDGAEQQPEDGVVSVSANGNSGVPEGVSASVSGSSVAQLESIERDEQAEHIRDSLDVADSPPTTVHPTPSLPTAAVALEAQGVASARRDSLRVAVSRMPQNWLLRRRLAEALFEAGDREAALHELETAQQGLVQAGDLHAAADIANELVQVDQDRIGYHQKRVELAVRLSDQRRLQSAYLDLADALVRMGEEGRARAVYARVLELDPYDDRARAALGAAAPPPPPPPPPARSDDQFVDLATWLSDGDEAASTRMRMREPTISGDEQADFDALLEHFKEGVSRSLGEDDFEGHYDLGVAYKEMGLLDDAIGEFQKALRSRTHRLAAYEALGQCFVEQERFQVASTVLTRALHEPGLDDEQRIGVLYLLGHSCEALQRRDDARGYFQRVYATDIQFRDVAARLAALDPIPR